MKGFNSERFRELFHSMEWASIEEIREAVRDDGVITEEFRENAFEEALSAAIRQELRTPTETGEPLGVSITGIDGERRYKSPKLFDDSDCKKVRQYHYSRAVYHARRVRYWESRADVVPAEQLDLDLSWIDAEEDAA